MTRSLIPTDYTHTRVLGFSVTRSVWDEFRAAISNPSAWELLWYSGGSVDIWADPNSPAWTANNHSLDPQENGGTGGLVNGISDSSDPTVGVSTIDRVILNISGLCTTAADPVVGGYNGGTRPNLSLTNRDTTGFTSGDASYANGYCNNVEFWRLYIDAAITNIKSKYANVKMIILQPAVGGPSNSQTTCTNADPFTTTFGVVRASYNAPYIYSACSVLQRGGVRMGYVPYVASCARYADEAGHIDSTGQTTIGQAMATYYDGHL